MNYISTRGQGKKLKFSNVLLEGLAPDGGLYVPEKLPIFTKEDLKEMSQLEYPKLALYIFKKFKVDILETHLKNILNESYSGKTFKNSRVRKLNEKIAPVIQLDKNLFIQELSNGPTLAFKDLAMQFLGNVFQYILGQKKKKLNIIGATSGDTGSAAEYAFKGKKNVNVFMLSPEGKMSEFQRSQMYSLMDKNIFNIAIKGMFDDAQDIVKQISLDKKFKQKYSIGAVNSINWARILAQTVYYFSGYFQVVDTIGEEIDFVVPTGNFGNIYSGYLAKECGLPIKQLVLVTNENDVLYEFFSTGIYRPRKSENTFVTSSPSMDISKASNLERFLFEFCNRDSVRLNNLVQDLTRKGMINLKMQKKKIDSFGIKSYASNHSSRLLSIKKVFSLYNIFIDTHTADGFSYIFSEEKLERKTVVLETAQAVKFAEYVEKATGKVLDSSVFIDIKSPQKIYLIDSSVSYVKKFVSESIGSLK